MDGGGGLFRERRGVGHLLFLVTTERIKIYFSCKHLPTSNNSDFRMHPAIKSRSLIEIEQDSITCKHKT